MKPVCWPLNKGWDITAVTSFKQPAVQSGAGVSVGGRHKVLIKANLGPSQLSRHPVCKLTTPGFKPLLSQPCQPSPAPVWKKEWTKSLFLGNCVISAILLHFHCWGQSPGSPSRPHVTICFVWCIKCIFHLLNQTLWRSPVSTPETRPLIKTMLSYLFFLAHTAGILESKKEAVISRGWMCVVIRSRPVEKVNLWNGGRS